MAAGPRWEMCWSTSNLTSFLTWFHKFATRTEQEETKHLHVLIHRMDTGPFLPTEIPIAVTIEGVHTPLPTIPCEEVGCERCRIGRGGYQFRWVDPRWTPEISKDMTLSPMEHFQKTSEPWPRGVRR